MSNPEQVSILGMILDEWIYESCIAHFGTGEKWATLYDIESGNKDKGHAIRLLLMAKDYYKKQGKKVMGTVALNPVMRKIYSKVGIDEIDHETIE